MKYLNVAASWIGCLVGHSLPIPCLHRADVAQPGDGVTSSGMIKRSFIKSSQKVLEWGRGIHTYMHDDVISLYALKQGHGMQVYFSR